MKYSVDDVSIPLDSLSLFYYQKHSIINSDSGWILYGFNILTHSIDIFNITKKKLLGHINLESQGPNEILHVYGINVKDPNLIYILDRLALKCLNKYGEVTKKYPLDFTGLPGNVEGYFIQLNEARFEVSDNGKYFTGYFMDSKINGERRKEYLKHPIIGTIDLTTREVKFLPVYYSDFIIDNDGDFSSEITPNIIYLKDKIIYGFPVESNFYVFDRASGSVKAYGGASKYCINYAKRYSSDKNYNFRNEGTWFNSVNYNPAGNYYYRTYWGSQPKYEKGRLTDGLTKPGYIMVFDDNFNIIDEIKLRDDLWLEDSFMTPEGLFFWPKIDEEYPADSLVLGRYRINIIPK